MNEWVLARRTASEKRDISRQEWESTATNLETATLSSAAAAVRRDAAPAPAGSAGATRSLTGSEDTEVEGEQAPRSERAARERKRHSSTCRRSFSCCSSRTAREKRRRVREIERVRRARGGKRARCLRDDAMAGGERWCRSPSGRCRERVGTGDILHRSPPLVSTPGKKFLLLLIGGPRLRAFISVPLYVDTDSQWPIRPENPLGFWGLVGKITGPSGSKHVTSPSYHQ